MQLVVECDSFNKTQQQVHKKLKTLCLDTKTNVQISALSQNFSHIRAAFAASHFSVKTEKFELNGEKMLKE